MELFHLCVSIKSCVLVQCDMLYSLILRQILPSHKLISSLFDSAIVNKICRFKDHFVLFWSLIIIYLSSSIIIKNFLEKTVTKKWQFMILSYYDIFLSRSEGISVPAFWVSTYRILMSFAPFGSPPKTLQNGVEIMKIGGIFI